MRQTRLDSPRAATQILAARPHAFGEIRTGPTHGALLIPQLSSERREYIPFAVVPNEAIVAAPALVIQNASPWCVALLASRLHMTWLVAVGGKLEARLRYSNTLVWNTYPAPRFTDEQLDALSKSARRILQIRYSHHPKTLAELYDPRLMPDDLRAAHQANDELLETMYVGRPFRTDTERLEHLFKLYAARTGRKRRDAA